MLSLRSVPITDHYPVFRSMFANHSSVSCVILKCGLNANHGRWSHPGVGPPRILLEYANGGQAAHITLSAADVEPGSCGHLPAAEALTAETQSGQVVQIDSRSLKSQIIAQGVLPFEGVAQRAGSDQLYVTARSSSGLPSVWEIPISACTPHA